MTDRPASSIIEIIGETPLVELARLVKKAGVEGRIVAKLDHLNPGFSKKDRIAKQIIEDAEASGALRSGQPVVELTSGNTGTGMAIVCAIKGHPFVAVMSKGNSVERARMMAALGAEVILVDQLPGSKKGQVSGGDLALVEEKTRQIVEQRQAFRADQFVLEGNYRAHYLHTGPEFIAQSDGRIDAFCDFVGTGGTFGGCAAALKEHNPSIRCFVVEPESAAVLAGHEVTDPNHPIQGGGYSLAETPFINRDHVDGYLQVTASDAIEQARALARSEGVFAGFSSGANTAAALQLLRGAFAGRTIAIMICDSGLKYLSTELWDSPFRG